jgi:alkylation response protein AidB-like acyl-CoA dehydrogenase
MRTHAERDSVARDVNTVSIATYSLGELLTDQERAMRDRVRQWCDTEVAPAAAGYWERAKFPVELAKGYGRLGIAGASIVGNGCPGGGGGGKPRGPGGA